ncbi:hypothetical protein GLE_2217 [Lysobacter enzymogenes]|uniref:Uncharacterized protein n=1 Tax=Lysobacter enzymogenes TaxID=69 RepID=A0A0S2DGN4_LYSEN|nr:hypothetical protein GLE_2217 [Lysobacter enzymogenes]
MGKRSVAAMFAVPVGRGGGWFAVNLREGFSPDVFRPGCGECFEDVGELSGERRG